MTLDSLTRRSAWSALAGAALAGALAIGCRAPESSDVSELLQRQTQELLDAIARGDRAPWLRYLHQAMIYSTEDGTTKSKAQLVDEIHALPKDVWGKLRVTGFRTTRHGATAVTSYVSEEDEGYFGQVIHARYRSTDTWIETAAGWQLVASQVTALRDDPPSVPLPAATLDEYVGVYALTDDITYTITRSGDHLIGARSGRNAESLNAELRDCLFVPGAPRLRKIFQRDAAGRIAGFVERRETWDIVWRRRQ
jgi:hypothetical protein